MLVNTMAVGSTAFAPMTFVRSILQRLACKWLRLQLPPVLSAHPLLLLLQHPLTTLRLQLLHRHPKVKALTICPSKPKDNGHMVL